MAASPPSRSKRSCRPWRRPRSRSSAPEIFVDIAIRFRDDLGDSSQAIDALVEAWKLDPTFEPILEALEPLLHAEQRWGEMLETSRALATSVADKPRSLAYAEAMVRWLTRDVPDPDLARQWVERIRAIDSTHWQVHMLQAAVSREHGDLKRELDELDLAVLSARRKDDRARIHLMMAERFLDEPRTFSLESAKKHYAAASKLYPKAPGALRGLEQVAEREKDRPGLAEVLRRLSDADIDDEQRVAVLLRLSKLEEELRKPELAAKTLERLVALLPNHPAALDGLETRVYCNEDVAGARGRSRARGGARRGSAGPRGASPAARRRARRKARWTCRARSLHTSASRRRFPTTRRCSASSRGSPRRSATSRPPFAIASSSRISRPCLRRARACT